MPLFRGVGPRIAQRLIDLGYVRTDGKPDVRRFCLERGYDKTLMYYWLGDRSTPVKELARLAADLKTTPERLLFGSRRPKAGAVIIGALLLGFALTVPAKAQPLPLVSTGSLQTKNAPYRKRRYSLATNWAPPTQLVVRFLAA